MNTTDKVAVCSRSFSRHPELRDELLSRYSNVTFNETGRQLEGEELIAFLRGHNKAITALERIDDANLAALPELQVIGKYGVGLDMIDLEAMRRHGKRLGWISGVNRRSAAELTLAFAIVMLRHVVAGNREILAGGWRQLMGGLLSGRTIGIIGCGHIGKEVVKRLIPFGVDILACDRLDFSEFYEEYSVEAVDQEELWARSDVLSVHLSRNATTIGLYSAEVLDKLKQGVYIVNTARGKMFDEVALKERLENGHIAAAAFDVFDVEPAIDNPLFDLPNFFGTPHTGAGAQEAWEAMARSGIKGLTENWIPEPGEYPYD